MRQRTDGAEHGSLRLSGVAPQLKREPLGGIHSSDVRTTAILLHGYHSAPADPLAGTIGVLGGAWAGTIGLRFLLAPDSPRPVMSQPLLFLTSLGALAGTVWFWTFTDAPDFRLKLTLEFGGAGILGLVLWWSRRKGRSQLR